MTLMVSQAESSAQTPWGRAWERNGKGAEGKWGWMFSWLQGEYTQVSLYITPNKLYTLSLTHTWSTQVFQLWDRAGGKLGCGLKCWSILGAHWGEHRALHLWELYPGWRWCLYVSIWEQTRHQSMQILLQAVLNAKWHPCWPVSTNISWSPALIHSHFSFRRWGPRSNGVSLSLGAPQVPETPSKPYICVISPLTASSVFKRCSL